MLIRQNNEVLSAIVPRYEGKEIVVAIDSSKSNSAFTVGDTHCQILDYYEFNGANDGTSETDTLNLCVKQREALKIIFQGSKPKLVGIENIVTKVTPGGRTGMTEHMSRFKITAVFMSFISFFQDNFGVTPVLVNNWSWKSAVLPEKYRSKQYEKGSLAYFKDIGSKYANCTDDVTDSICIFQYLCKTNGMTDIKPIDQPEAARFEHTIVIVSKDMRLKHPEVGFQYNKEIGITACASVMANSIDKSQVGTALININDLDFGDIYKYCVGKFTSVEPYVKLVVMRKG